MICWLNSWSEGSRRIQLDRALEEGMDESFWEGIWQKKYPNTEAILLRKIKSGMYIIIEVRFEYKTGEAESYLDDIVLKKEKEKWYVTLDLAMDPMKEGWKYPSDRKRYTKRGPEDNPETLFENNYWKLK